MLAKKKIIIKELNVEFEKKKIFSDLWEPKIICFDTITLRNSHVNPSEVSRRGNQIALRAEFLVALLN